MVYYHESALAPVGFRSDQLSDVSQQFQSFPLPSDHIHYATYFRYAIPEIVEEERILYLDCDMIFTQDLSPLFEVDLRLWTGGSGR